MDLPFVESLEPADRDALTGWQPGDAWLAGGTWLFSEPQPRVRRLLDLRAFAWAPLTVTEAGLEIAATCTLAELEGFEPPCSWPAGPLLRQTCEALLGSFKVWNEATVGGNVCLSLPAGPMTSLAASLDGVCTIWKPEAEERVPALRFVTGHGRNVLRPGELLRSVLLPERALRAQTAFRQFSRTPLGRSAAVVIGRRDPEAGEVVVTITAAAVRPGQLRFASLPTDVELQAALAEAELEYFDDPHGSADWRAHLTRRLCEQVRAELGKRAT
jgi:CO/xanthine dehydrogenase FAD-binding subunit